MATDISHLPLAVRDQLVQLDAGMTAEIRRGMAHSIARHELNTVMIGAGLCDDSVIVVCGPAVYARIAALRAAAQELFATATASAAVERAKAQ